MAAFIQQPPVAVPTPSGPVTRKYQEEMLQESLRRNIIIVLDTGSGKTHIALLRIRIEVERQIALGSKKACWFLVPTVALCEQQTAVFREHLPYNIDSITGAKQPDKWTSESLWRDIVANNSLVVSTAQVLLEALRHAYLKLDRDIAMLIFDEAHHATKGHPYARIMREYFDGLPESSRPAIMGLTASPLDIEVLEKNLLCCALTTQENEEELKRYVFPPTFKHIIYTYAPSDTPKPASLQSLEKVFDSLDIEKDPHVVHLRSRLHNPALTDAAEKERLTSMLAKAVRKKSTITFESMKKLVQSARDTFIELGAWATDWFIAHSISKLLRPVDAAQDFSFFDTKRSTNETRYLRSVLEQVEIPATSLSPDDVAAGVADQIDKLIKVLLEDKETTERLDETYSGIIFVKLRTAALLVAQILKYHPATRDTFKVGFLVGWSNDERKRNVLDLVVNAGSEKDQLKTLQQFREGEINLMIATSVLEEGLDVPICNNVVRFNRPDNITSWVQSRGRARAKRSSFVVMFNNIENGTFIVRQLEALEEQMNAKYRQSMRERTVEPPQREGNQQYYRVPETGALLTIDNATAHISHFCDTLGRKEYAHMAAVYDVFPPDGFMDELVPGAALPPLQSLPQLYGCTLTLPNILTRELRRFETPMIHPSPKAARRQVAFDAYQKLQQVGLVNTHLLPTRPAVEEEARDVGSQSQKREGLMQVPPQKDAWAMVDETLAESEYWSFAITVEDVGEIQMLAKVEPPLEQLELVLYERNVPHKVTVRATGRVVPSAEELNAARHATKLLWWSAYGSHMNWERVDFVHLFVIPRDQLESSWRPTLSTDTLAVSLEDLIAQHGLVEDIFTVRDARDSRARYEWYQFRGWRSDTLSEAEVLEVAKRYPNIPEDEPLEPPFIAVVKLRRQPNSFVADDATLPSGQKTRTRILHPRFCKADILPPHLGRLSLLLPSVLRDIQQTIMSRDVQRQLYASERLRSVPLPDIRTAITTPLTGDLVNYQRVETLGDCVLKFLTSVQLMGMHPEWHEGFLTMVKDHVVSNYNLANENKKNSLANWIIRDRMVARKWRPRLIGPVEAPAPKPVKEGEPIKEDEEPVLSSKVLADVVESLIGAAHETGGYDAAIEILQRLNVGAKVKIEWKPLSERVASIVSRIEPLPSGYPVDYVQTLERMIGHTFKHPSLLLEALTHANYSGDVHTVSYERLEFLGDSLLDNVVTAQVYYSHRRLPPVLMTRCRIATVNMEILAFCCAGLFTTQEQRTVVGSDNRGGAEYTTTERVLRLPTFLRISNIAMLGVIRDYLSGVDRARADIQQKLLHGKEYPWTELFALRAPKFLGDIVESLLGAIYLDTDGDMAAVEAFIDRLGLLRVVRHLVEDGVDVRHPLTVLGEYAAKCQGKLRYKFTVTDGTELTCVVLLNDEEIVTLTGDNRLLKAREELKVRAAARAYSVIKQRLAAAQVSQ